MPNLGNKISLYFIVIAAKNNNTNKTSLWCLAQLGSGPIDCWSHKMNTAGIDNSSNFRYTACIKHGAKKKKNSSQRVNFMSFTNWCLWRHSCTAIKRFVSDHYYFVRFPFHSGCLRQGSPWLRMNCRTSTSSSSKFEDLSVTASLALFSQNSVYKGWPYIR